MDESDFRRVVLVREVERDPPSNQWTADDPEWASRAAEHVPAADFVAERARRALQRLRDRGAGWAAWADAPPWRTGWTAAALVLGTVLGWLTVDLLSPGRVDIARIALAVAGLTAWNLALLGVVLWGLVRGRPQGGRWLRLLVEAWPHGHRESTAARRAQHSWRVAAAPALRARALVVLHMAGAGLALGAVAAVYQEGLLRDLRAGWETTFLSAELLHAALSVLLAPAAALTGLGVPGLAGVTDARLAAGAPATASPLPWIHLFAAALALYVVLPRLVLAAVAAVQARRHARALALPVAERLYVDALQRWRGRRGAAVEVRAHVRSPEASAVQTLSRALERVLGAQARIGFAEPVPFGSEETLAAAAAGTTLRILLFDAGATPEEEQQGRLLAAASRDARLLVCDEGPFRRRFAHLPERIDERRRAWRKLAAAHGVAIAFVDLGADVQPVADAIARALDDPVAQAGP